MLHFMPEVFKTLTIPGFYFKEFINGILKAPNPGGKVDIMKLDRQAAQGAENESLTNQICKAFLFWYKKFARNQS